MFVPCPHCQFLVAHHPQLQPLPDDCPRCGKPLQDDCPRCGKPLQDDETTAGAQDTKDAAVPDAGAVSIGGGHACDEAPITGANATSAQATTDTGAFASVARPGRRDRWRWPLIALLGLLLVLQILLADRARLAADPRWRPLLETLCGALRCDLPPWDEAGAFTMLDRKVRPATQPGALRVDATFRNDARWPQPWPALQLALSDADGRVLGSRVFQPAEYLGAAPATLLSPDQSAQITFVVREPAPGTVAFSFEFR
jgi:hypothetical protein